MSRFGVEEKPPWRMVPLAVRQDVGEAMGSSVVRGMRVYGGYGPTPTYRLALSDGRRVFFKGVNARSYEFPRAALALEVRVYRELADFIGPWAPRFYAAIRRDDWSVLLLEDVGPKTVPPWTPAAARRIVHAYANFHAATLDHPTLPEWLPRPESALPQVTWSRVAAESEELRRVAELAGEAKVQALRWLQAALPLMSRLADSAAFLSGPHSLLHGDTRSDNLRVRDGRLYLFDWPAVQVGRYEFDLVAFAQSVTVDGGVDPEQVLTWYGERLALRPDAIDAALAWLSAFFADLAWRPGIHGLPRLRAFQRQQLAVSLVWASRRWHLPEPTWVSALASASPIS